MPYLGAAYLWVKAAHVIFVIFLMAGLFMMPRFFVYHQETAPGSPEDQRWICLLYTSPSPRDRQKSRMPSSA